MWIGFVISANLYEQSSLLVNLAPESARFPSEVTERPALCPHLGSGLIVRMRLSLTILVADEKYRGL